MFLGVICSPAQSMSETRFSKLVFIEVSTATKLTRLAPKTCLERRKGRRDKRDVHGVLPCVCQFQTENLQCVPQNYRLSTAFVVQLCVLVVEDDCRHVRKCTWKAVQLSLF